MSRRGPGTGKSRTGKVRVLSSKVMFRGRVYDVRRDEVIEPGGLRATREVVVHHGSVVILPVLPDGRIVLVRQFRYAAGRFLWELCAGHLEPREKLVPAARRELREETGYRARRLCVLFDFFPTPGFLTERMHVLLATGLTAGAAQPEEDEKIKVQAFTRSELQKMIRKGIIQDGKSIAAILYYLRFHSGA